MESLNNWGRREEKRGRIGKKDRISHQFSFCFMGKYESLSWLLALCLGLLHVV
jgi:hypothetical protein